MGVLPAPTAEEGEIDETETIKKALLALPSTLDETYERMLCGIEDMYRDEALTIFRWLVYARSPPSIGELAEAAIIEPRGDGVVDIDSRGAVEDLLGILAGLIAQ